MIREILAHICQAMLIKVPVIIPFSADLVEDCSTLSRPPAIKLIANLQSAERSPSVRSCVQNLRLAQRFREALNSKERLPRLGAKRLVCLDPKLPKRLEAVTPASTSSRELVSIVMRTITNSYVLARAGGAVDAKVGDIMYLANVSTASGVSFVRKSMAQLLFQFQSTAQASRVARRKIMMRCAVFVRRIPI